MSWKQPGPELDGRASSSSKYCCTCIFLGSIILNCNVGDRLEDYVFQPSSDVTNSH
jgi:hypothetical protein